MTSRFKGPGSPHAVDPLWNPDSSLFAALDVPVKMLLNDAFGLTPRHLAEMRANLFNFSLEHPIGKIRELAGPQTVLWGREGTILLAFARQRRSTWSLRIGD